MHAKRTCIRHKYTRPYRLQTNAKAERFSRTLPKDWIEDTVFENIEQLKDELTNYNNIWATANQARAYQSINHNPPAYYHQFMATK